MAAHVHVTRLNAEPPNPSAVSAYGQRLYLMARSAYCLRIPRDLERHFVRLWRLIAAVYGTGVGGGAL